jgi:hypothetical protein
MLEEEFVQVKTLTTIASIVLLLLVGQVDIRAQSPDGTLQDKRININLYEKPLWDVFLWLMDKYDIAIGLEQSNLDPEPNDLVFLTDKPPKLQQHSARDRQFLLQSADTPANHHLFTIQHDNASLETVMGDIVRQMKYYDWEISGGVVNIFPVRGREPKFQKLLDVRIKQFRASKGMEVGMIQAIVLFRLPEFRAFLRENDLRPSAVEFTKWDPKAPLENEMNFSDLSFRELLNAIVRSKRGGWILKRYINSSGNADLDVIELFI